MENYIFSIGTEKPARPKPTLPDRKPGPLPKMKSKKCIKIARSCSSPPAPPLHFKVILYCFLRLPAMVAKGWLLENNSEDTLSVYMALFYSTYPDTLIPQTFKDGMLNGRGAFPHETGGFYATKFEPEETFKDSP